MDEGETIMPLPIGHWTEERIDALKLYASQGYTCSQIAGLLGMATRNSIIGKLHRLGLTTKNQPGGGFKKKLSRPKPRTLKSRIASTKWSASGSKVIPPLDFEDLLA